MSEQTNTLLAKTDSGELYVLGDATGFSVNGNEVKFQGKAGTIAYTSDCLSSAGDGLRVSGNVVSAKVRDGEKVITVSSDGFATTLSMAYETSGSATDGRRVIALRGVGDDPISVVDVSGFAIASDLEALSGKVDAANDSIRTALDAQGVDVSDYTSLSQAADKIALVRSLRAEEPDSLYAEYDFIET